MKNKYNIIKWVLMAVVCLTTFNACVDEFNVGDKYLEKAPGTELPLDTVFSKAELARYFLWETYDYIYYAFDNGKTGMNSGLFETLGDCQHSNVGWNTVCAMYYSGSYNASQEGTYEGFTWGRFSYLGDKVWPGVRKGWLFIENIDRVPDMSAPEKARLKAEAKIIIATRYFDLLRHVGGLPIVDHAYGTYEDFEAPRATIEQTIEFVVKLLDEAAAEPNLPWNIPDAEIENWAGRLTKASAMGLKCKVLLYAASPLFNDNVPYTTESPQIAVEKRQVWYGAYKPEYWTRCVDACKDFFRVNTANNDYYKLIQAAAPTEEEYCKAYRKAYWSRGNSEKIIEVHHVFKMSEWDQMPTNVAHYGGYAPTLEFMELFPYADGRPFKEQSVYDTNNPNNIDIFEKRDPRLYETMVVQKKDFKWQGKQVELWAGGSMLNGTAAWFGNQGFMVHGFPQFKWITDYRHHADEPVQWPYLRMAEVHLIYAEALAETGDLAGACREVNKVRNRVGLKNIEVSNPDLQLTTNKDNLVKEIIRERACELGYEDTRFFDLIRRKMSANFKTPLHALDIYRKDGNNKPLEAGEGYPQFVYKKRQITKYARAWWNPGFWSDKWFLSAMPINEINKDYGLTQNPGW